MKIRLFTIPNLLTLSNLLCGSFAAVAALKYNQLEVAFFLIITAAVFDFFDGFAARLLKCPSPIGVELDSLADMVSFGFAPAAVFYSLYGSSEAHFAWNADVAACAQYVPFIITAFSALRLAKFNIDDTQHTEFEGLTTTANAMFCSSIGWLAVTGNITLPREMILGLSVVMAFMLISPVRMFALKFKGFGWQGNELRYSFIAFLVVLFALLQWKAIPLAILVYVAVSLVRWLRGAHN